MKNQKAVETLEIQNKTEHPININFQSLNNSQHTHTLESLPVCFWLHISPSPCFLTANNENEASPHASSCLSWMTPTDMVLPSLNMRQPPSSFLWPTHPLSSSLSHSLSFFLLFLISPHHLFFSPSHDLLLLLFLLLLLTPAHHYSSFHLLLWFPSCF